MRCLAFEASTEALSVAYLDTAKSSEPDEIFEIAPREHARRLLPAARRLLDQHRCRLEDLDTLAFARGPGAFTGLRIAAGLVQGLAIGAGRPVIGISTLAVIAARAFHDAPHAQRVQVVQDARMGEIYTACFSRKTMPEPLTEERVIAPDALILDRTVDTLAAGNGWHLVAHAGDVESVAIWPHAADVARLAERLAARGVVGGPPDEALPVYVRDDVARKPATSI